ncbi:MAG: GIY-YIG nuclease family protein [bacterium]|nr:GIY-YIG nuclease family protein [bacterium]
MNDSNGRSIRIFLVDGDASGLLTAEVMNWSGKLLMAPRTKLAELAKREEISRTGVYILAGADPENPAGEVVYVGEGDNVYKRLAVHDKDERRDFWTRCVAVISKDLNLTKAHVRYLESRLISIGCASGRAKIQNGTAPPLPPMPEADVADMEGFLKHVELVLPVLGFSFLKSRPVVESATAEVTDRSPVFEFCTGEATAKAREIDGEFVVQMGSTALMAPKDSWTSYRGLRERLVDQGKLVEVPDKPLLLFTEDIVFNSPSAGAAVVNAGNINGRTAWKVPATKISYAEWHQSQLPSASDEVDD